MREEEILDGEIYVFNERYLNKICLREKLNVSCFIHINESTFSDRRTRNLDYADCREATLEEKYWLNKCIELKIFVSKEEALKDYPSPSSIIDDMCYLIELFSDRGIC